MSIQSYGSYIYAIDDLIKEIKDDLVSDDKALIKEKIKLIGKDGYWKWFYANIDMIKAYASATPSRRKSTKKWNTDELRVMLVLGAIHYLQSSQHFMVVTNELITTADRSYRGVSAIAGEAYFLTLKSHINYYML